MYKLCLITLLINQRSQPRVFYKTYIIQPEGISMDHLVQPFQDKLPVSKVSMFYKAMGGMHNVV